MATVPHEFKNCYTNLTRLSIRGQGECVSSINSVNVLVDRLVNAHSDRYISEESLTRFTEDFYSSFLR